MPRNFGCSALTVPEASLNAAMLFWALEISCRSFVNVFGGELIVELDAGGVSGLDSRPSCPWSFMILCFGRVGPTCRHKSSIPHTYAVAHRESGEGQRGKYSKHCTSSRVSWSRLDCLLPQSFLGTPHSTFPSFKGKDCDNFREPEVNLH